MSSDRNLMHFIFNQLLSPQRDRYRASVGRVLCLALFLGCGLASNTVRAQSPFYWPSQEEALPTDPRHFGDTPSPTEMMARLKFHKHQETPLFDLLRESGLDIFSKLSDDEKKLAGRFVEDMILKEGLDSERVSSLLEKMNIDDQAKKALQEGIERAGVDESASSPEQRKRLARLVEKIRKDLPQRSASTSRPSQSRENQNRRQFERSTQSDLAARQAREAIKRREELGISSPPEPSSSRNQTPSNATNRTASENRRAERRVAENGRTPDRRQTEAETRRSERTEPNRELARRRTEPNSRNRQPRPNRRGGEVRQPNSRQSNNRRPDNSNSPAEPGQKRPVRQAFDQLDSQLTGSQKKIVSELRDKVRRGGVSRQEISEALSELKKAKSVNEFAGRLDEVGKKLNLPEESRQEIQRAYNSLSRIERSSLKEAFGEVDDDLLKQLASSNFGQGFSRGAGNPSNSTSRPSGANSGLAGDAFGDLPIEQLGKDFLEDALKTYNDAESGYQLSPAFKRLKERAEGKKSDREMMNFGNLSKKLFEQGANIFDPDSLAESSKPAGVKPGQRFDQLIVAAAEEALSKDNTTDGDNESFFSGMINSALGTAIGQAVDIADKDKGRSNRDVPENWNQSSQSPADDFNLDPTSSLENSNDSQNSVFSVFTPKDASSSSDSNSKSTLDGAASSLADSVSKIEINWWALLYVAGGVAAFVIIVWLLSRLIKPVDETVRKQRELQLKLQTNSANPKDVVEAVDLFLLSRFGAASSWWNAKHAADQIATDQPGWREKVASLFQVYRWSRYQADGNASVSAEQNELVKSTLHELSQASDKTLGATVLATVVDSKESSGANEEATE